MASVERNTVDQRAACHSSRSLSTIAWNWDTVGKSDPPVNSFGLRLLTQRPQVRSGSLPNATAPKGTRKTVKPLPSISLGASKPAEVWMFSKSARGPELIRLVLQGEVAALVNVQSVEAVEVEVKR